MIKKLFALYCRPLYKMGLWMHEHSVHPFWGWYYANRHRIRRELEAQDNPAPTWDAIIKASKAEWRRVRWQYKAAIARWVTLQCACYTATAVWLCWPLLLVLVWLCRHTTFTWIP